MDTKLTTKLKVVGRSYAVTTLTAQLLARRKAIYWCDDCNAHHLDPEHDFSLEEVERLVGLPPVEDHP